MLEPRNVLVIEDDRVFQMLFRDDLFQRQSTKVEIDDGTRFRELLSGDTRWDLILLDFDLGRPDLNGRHVLNLALECAPSACIGLISSLGAGGFSAQDSDRADFYFDKGNFGTPEDVLSSIRDEWKNFMREACSPAIRDEWSALQTVIVHRPGAEIRYVNPEDREELMEDRPNELEAGKEHDTLVAALQKAGARVLDTHDLLTDALAAAGADERAELLARVLFEDSWDRTLWGSFQSARKKMPGIMAEFIRDAVAVEPAIVAGWLLEGRSSQDWPTFAKSFRGDFRFLLDYLNNAYFTRDPGFALDGTFVTSRMTKRKRRREARLLDLILSTHPWFSGNNSQTFSGFFGSDDTPPSGTWVGPSESRIEGGDVLAIGPGRLAIGWSERTNLETIETLARRLMEKGYSYEEIFAVSIPRQRTYMHLDTVFTFVSPNLAVCFPDALKASLEYKRFSRSGGTIRQETGDDFLELLEGEGLQLIKTGGGDVGLARADQWNDATNCFAVDTNKVITYGFNRATNRALTERDVDVIEVSGSELVKGRGGPRCMTMPIRRRC